VGVLARENPAAAEGVLAKLSELLRRVLRQEPGHEIPLREELAILDGYLAIQRVRFEDRLRVRVSVPDELNRALVPELVLQPLVENAIRYAVEPRVDGGRIEVIARREGDRLVIEVGDDGPGWAEQGNQENGAIGVANTRARLARLHGASQQFRLGTATAGGLLVTMSLPYRESRA
jgi:LytS/YehU family sensor histidine kinase